jgi:hypothetical protein
LDAACVNSACISSGRFIENFNHGIVVSSLEKSGRVEGKLSPGPFRIFLKAAVGHRFRDLSHRKKQIWRDDARTARPGMKYRAYLEKPGPASPQSRG